MAMSPAICASASFPKSRPGVQTHARVDSCAVLFEVEVVASERELVNGAEGFSLLANNFVQRDEIKGGGGRGGGSGRWSRRGGPRDEVQRRLDGARQIHGFAMSMNMHVKEARLFEEKMVVQRG